MTPKVLSEGTHLFQPRTAYQWGEGPQPALPGNGYGQAVMTYANPPYGADIVYRLASAASGGARLVISDAAGDTLANLTGPGAAGVNHVTWNFQQLPPTRAPAEASPSQRRDSILLRIRAPQVLDSLSKTKYDTAAIRVVRAQVAGLVNPAAAGAGRGGRGGRGGGGGGGGGGRGGAGGQACEHPTTQWETFCARPAETPAGARGGGGGGNAAAPLTPQAERIWTMIGMNPPAPAGGRGGGGGGGGGGAPTTAGTGDYLVTLFVNEQSYRQSFHVECVSGGSDGGFQFGEDENHDQSGRYTPKGTPRKKQ